MIIVCVCFLSLYFVKKKKKEEGRVFLLKTFFNYFRGMSRHFLLRHFNFSLFAFYFENNDWLLFVCLATPPISSFVLSCGPNCSITFRGVIGFNWNILS